MGCLTTKLIYYYEIDEWELFDLKEDPEELTNYYGSDGYESIQKRLTNKLKDLREKYKDDTGESVEG